MRFEGKEVQTRLCEILGIEPKDIKPEMVFLLVKIAKHCRLRCRSNAALHNWVRNAFPSLEVRTVKMESKYKPGEKYDALQVFNPALAGGVAKVEEQDGE